MIMTITFWKSAGETAIKAAAASALAVIGTDQLVSALGVDWGQVAGIALLAAVVSLLTSIVVPAPETRAAKRQAVAEAERKARVEAAAKAKAAQEAKAKAAATAAAKPKPRTATKRPNKK